MKIYLVIDEQDTDAAWGCNVTPFLNRDAAVEHMKKDYEEALGRWEFDISECSDEHYASGNENGATIRDGSDVEHWRIEEHDLSVELAVEVKGGLVQNVYANADVSVDVYDLDVSDFPDEGEQEEADNKEVELEELVKSPGWRNVW